MPENAAAALDDFAPAKVNLTLRVVGRRADGYHLLHSLVAFADVGDRLSLVPGDALTLRVAGATAAQAGPDADNLVLKAARSLAERIPALKVGAFRLVKELPAAAGIGGGSSDAAAALRLLAKLNGLSPSDARVYAAAVATGADVPVCLDPRARYMSGVGEVLSAPAVLPSLPAVLVNPGVAVPTGPVFQALRLDAATPVREPRSPDCFASRDEVLAYAREHPNDLEAPAVGVAPIVADALAALRAQAGARLARMSGSGATCFALFDTAAQAESAAAALATAYPEWWVQRTTLR